MAESAVTYAASCKEFGIDPAEEIEDPFLKTQLRVGLLYATNRFLEKQEAKDNQEYDVEFDGPIMRKDVIDAHKERIASAKERLGKMEKT